MKPFATQVLTTAVPPGRLGVFFLGQAGFLFKLPSGKVIAVDPYLSNCCERYFGFKRLMPRLMEPGEVPVDLLLISHAHYDHFDPDSVPQLLSGGRTRLVGARDVEAECARLGLRGDISFLAPEQETLWEDVRVTAVPCDHGELAPDAVGLLVEAAGKRIYYMGDTAYRPQLLEDDRLRNADLLLLPINGAFGNLNEEEAARVIRKLEPKLAVPCHYWNFAEHGGDPGLFQTHMKALAPEQPYLLMGQGEGILI